MIFIVVDFPAPLGPKNPTISPFSTEKDIVLTAFCVPYVLVIEVSFNDIDLQISIEFLLHSFRLILIFHLRKF